MENFLKESWTAMAGCRGSRFQTCGKRREMIKKNTS